MERRKRLRRVEKGTPRFLTISCHQRLPLLGRAEWRDVFAESLARARERCGFRLIGWVAMPEHVHLMLLASAECDAARALIAIKQPVAQRALRRWRELDAPVLEKLRVGDGYRYWQAGGGFDRNVRDAEEMRAEVEYMHHNPVRRGLVDRAEDWAWSSARWYAGERDGVVPIDPVVW